MKSTSEAEIVAVRRTFDGAVVNFHANGEVSFRTSFLRGKLPLATMWKVAENVCLWTADELPSLLREARAGRVRAFRVRVDIPESQRLYKVVKIANGLDVSVRIR